MVNLRVGEIYVFPLLLNSRVTLKTIHSIFMILELKLILYSLKFFYIVAPLLDLRYLKQTSFVCSHVYIYVFVLFIEYL